MTTEQRLIDANEAYEIARTSGLHDDFGRCMADLTSLKELLEDCTTVDAVEVVRCKDCKFAYINSLSAKQEKALCNRHFNPDGNAAIMGADDFCSYGERRTDHV